MIEEWKDIRGYEGSYQVSNLGRVRSLSRKTKAGFRKGMILVLMIDKFGYSLVNLSRKSYKVHRLVAETFIDNPQGLKCVNHKDENKTNNCVDNLEWCSYEYNNNYGSRNMRISQNSSRKKRIVQFDLNGNAIREWESILSASKFYGVGRTCICACCNGRQKTSAGYIWGYANE